MLVAAERGNKTMSSNSEPTVFDQTQRERAVKKVQLILDKSAVGYLELNAQLLENPEDFRCNPQGIISFEKAQEIARRMIEGGTWGYVERYRWQLESEPEEGGLKMAR